MASVLQHTRRKLDVDSVYDLLKAGRIGPEERVELVEGELLTVPAIGSRHASATSRLIERLFEATDRTAVLVTGSMPLRLDRFNELEPDVLVLRRRADAFAASHPTPADTLLVVEVADTTRSFDLGRKAALYARFGVAESWVVDLVARHVRVHRDPQGDTYAHVEPLAAGALTPRALPGVAMDVAAVVV
jgi:hypothetical protein